MGRRIIVEGEGSSALQEDGRADAALEGAGKSSSSCCAMAGPGVASCCSSPPYCDPRS
jgi:hypothetical protein